MSVSIGESIHTEGWDYENVEFLALREEIDRAIAKHGFEQTPLNPGMFPSQKLIICVEEVGEVARAMTYDEGSQEKLKKEVLQAAAMYYSWFLSMENA